MPKLFAIALSLFAVSYPAIAETCKVKKVVDGDTAHLICGGEIKKVRVCGIDAPETAHGKKAAQPYGNESKRFVWDWIKKANYEVDLTELEKDKYGRSVGEIFSGSNFLSADVVKAGLAYEYKKYSKTCPHREQITQAEAIAKRNKVGLWDGGNYQDPAQFKRGK